MLVEQAIQLLDRISGMDLNGARILLTNDDGIHAHGIKVLEQIAREFTDDVWVCAPATEQSGKSHSLSLHGPIELFEHGPQRFAVGGTPTDCVIVAMEHLFKDQNKPDVVLSGINMGSNLAEDVCYSGTVSAAVEATMMGVPSVAFSQRLNQGVANWDTPLTWGPAVLRRIGSVALPPNVLVSVNFPSRDPDEVKGVTVCPMGIGKSAGGLEARTSPRGQSYFWLGPMSNKVGVAPGADFDVVMSGGISVTPLQVERTYNPLLAPLETALTGTKAGESAR